MGNMISKPRGSECEEKEECMNWSNSPQDILESILRRLCPADYLRCGAVCRWWRTVVGNATGHKNCPPAPQLPVLVLSFKRGYDKDPCIYSLSRHKLHYHQNGSLYKATQWCVGSEDGWLIMMDTELWYDNRNINRLYYFLNPASGHRIMLPCNLPLPQHLQEENGLPIFFKIVASSIPVDGQGHANCRVAGRSYNFLAYGWLDGTPWTHVEESTRMRISDIEFHDGKLYVAINSIESIMVCDLDQDPKAQRLVQLEHKLMYPRGRFHMEDNIGHVIDGTSTNLAKDPVSGGLLLILNIFDYAFDINENPLTLISCRSIIPPKKRKGFRVFKLNVRGDFRLVEMDNLVDRLIFVSNETCRVIPTTSLNGSQGCIYFSYHDNSSELKISMFSMSDKVIQCIKVLEPGLDSDSSEQLLCVRWFIPKLW